jgi:hypothetical protein
VRPGARIGPLSLVLAILVSVSCGGSGGGGPVVECNAIVVNMLCGGRADRFTQRIRIVIGGATSSTDIQGFNFDLVYDSAEILYAGGAEQGDLLNRDGDDPLLAVSLDNGVQGRLIVAIHRTNQPQGVQGPDPVNEILSLNFELTDPDAALAPSPILFENAEAVGTTGTIPGITFVDGLSLAFEP